MAVGILLVGGFGTRLKPLTSESPKPMLPVGGLPVTEHQLGRAVDQLDRARGRHGHDALSRGSDDRAHQGRFVSLRELPKRRSQRQIIRAAHRGAGS